MVLYSQSMVVATLALMAALMLVAWLSRLSWDFVELQVCPVGLVLSPIWNEISLGVQFVLAPPRLALQLSAVPTLRELVLEKAEEEVEAAVAS